MKTIKALIILLFISLTAQAQVSVGEVAPDFTLNVLGSQDSITLSDLADKVVYIFFYGADCPHCKTNGPVTESEINQMFNDNENFVAFGLDTWNRNSSANTAFKNVTGITYPLLLNARETLDAYYGNTSSYDRSVVIGPNNILQYRGTSFVNNDYEDVNEVIQAQLDLLATSNNESSSKPVATSLLQNYPNPFNPSTNISFQLNESGFLSLSIFNALGQHITTLADGLFNTGSHTITWDAKNMPSGVYYYQLDTGSNVQTKKMLLIK